MSLTLRAAKGAKLTKEELDANFSFLLEKFVAFCTNEHLESRITDLLQTAPANLDTLGEIAAKLNDGDDVHSALVTNLAGKTDKSYVDGIKDALETAIAAKPDTSYVDSLKGDTVNNLGNVSGNVAINFASGSYAALTPTAAAVLSITNIPDGVKAYGLTLEITNGGTKITWPASITWLNGSAPSLKAAGANVITLITRNGGTSYLGTSI